MRTPLRIIQTKIIKKGVRGVSILKGLKTIFNNIYLILTQKLLTGGNGWIEIYGEETETISDYSLVVKEGDVVAAEGHVSFEPTPTDSKDSEVCLQISQSIE